MKLRLVEKLVRSVAVITAAVAVLTGDPVRATGPEVCNLQLPGAPANYAEAVIQKTSYPTAPSPFTVNLNALPVPPIPSGIPYLAWCIDQQTPLKGVSSLGTNYTGALISWSDPTLNAQLPPHPGVQVSSNVWKQVNWILNNRTTCDAVAVKTMEVQSAIWMLVGGPPIPSGTFGYPSWSTSVAQCLTNAAYAAVNGATPWEPQCGDKTAVIYNIDLNANEDLTDDVQLLMLEVPCPCASLGDYVWLDGNASTKDGIQNEVDTAGINGIQVDLLDCSNNPVLDQGGSPISTLTANDSLGKPGYYLFDNLFPGCYRVKFHLPSSGTLQFTTPNVGSDDLDSDANPTSGITGDIQLPNGVSDRSWDAGLYDSSQGGGGQLGSLGNYVWVDSNGNGIQDEPPANGFNGVRVHLLDCSGNPVLGTDSLPRIQVTADNGPLNPGYYLFDKLDAGCYSVRFDDLPLGYVFTTQNASGSTAANGSDANTSTGITPAVILSVTVAGVVDNNLTVDAGLLPPVGDPPTAFIGDRVWYDLNADGIQDTGELGVGGVTVTLHRTSDNGVAGVQTTSAGGLYLFEVLPGDYYVVFSGLPAGYTFSPSTAGGLSDPNDSDANPLNGQTDSTTLDIGENDLTWDAGIYLPATEGNCTYTIGYYKNHPEVIMATVQNPIYLGTPGGVKTLVVTSAAKAVDVLNQKTYGTPSNGITKLYAQLLAAKLSILLGANPGAVSTAITQADAILALNDPASWDSSSSSVQSAINALHASFDAYNNGLIGPGHCDGNPTPDPEPEPEPEIATIGNRVWDDANNNGVQDNGESGVNGVTVQLLKCSDNTLAGTTTTSGGGLYGFTVAPGDYYVKFSNLPSGYVFSPSTAGSASDASDSDANATTGKTDCTTLTAGENDPSWDAGIHLPAPVYGGCTYTIGYYKNHASVIPVSNGNPIYLGTQGGAKTLAVTSQSMAVNVLSQSFYGTSANGITKLYAQLLAAKISIRLSANPGAVSSVSSQADALLAQYNHTDWYGLSSSIQSTISSLHSALDDYNNGRIGPGHCDGPADPVVGTSGGLAATSGPSESNDSGGVPSPWQTRDIGSVAAPGSATYVSSSGLYTLNGSGADIWGTSDEFRFVYQQAVGNCSVVARITGVEGTDPWAKAGVMIRESLSANSEHASVFVTPSNGVAFQWRDASGGVSENINQTGLTAPYWVKITRSSSKFTAYRSPNGSSWTKIGEATIPMTSSCYIGLAVTSRADGEICTATIDGVSGTP